MSAKSAKLSMRVQVVHRALKRAILDHALLPGAKLPEDTIGEPFGVSRTLVREALVRLSEEGLVEMRANRGAIVARPGLEESRGIFATRFALERVVVETMCGHVTPQQEQELSRHIDAEDAARDTDEATSIRLAGEFHTLLASMTGNAILIRYVNELVARSSLILAQYVRAHSAESAVSEHRAILSSLLEGNREKAIEQMQQHLEGITSRALLPNGQADDAFASLAGYAVAEGLIAEESPPAVGASPKRRAAKRK
ncbi:MAG: GntR family transcriptional regulator [Devosia sp.]|nr:GntR family transcriptional regulator [Devosia sp.]